MPRTVEMTTIERTIEHYKGRESECWIFLGYRRPNGYGECWLDGRRQYAHRATYQLLVGPIPDGLTIDHLCRNPACCNPAHLEPVTHRENMLRGETVGARNARVTHCPRGHAYTPDNTRLSKRGTRYCMACNRLNALKFHRMRRAHQNP